MPGLRALILKGYHRQGQVTHTCTVGVRYRTGILDLLLQALSLTVLCSRRRYLSYTGQWVRLPSASEDAPSASQEGLILSVQHGTEQCPFLLDNVTTFHHDHHLR